MRMPGRARGPDMPDTAPHAAELAFYFGGGCIHSGGNETVFCLPNSPPELTPKAQPRLGLVDGIARSDAPIHIRGLCHWAGEPAGHLGADSPSRRAAEHASAKRTKPPCPHWLRGLSQAHHVNAVSRHRRVPPFASSRRPLTHALAHLQWQEPPRFIDASATSRASIKEPSPSRGPTTRPLRASPRHP